MIYIYKTYFICFNKIFATFIKVKKFQMEQSNFLGLRLRNIYDIILTEVKHYYKSQEINFEPRCFPVIFLLRDKSGLCVTEIARVM
jgi:hypothetical protein